MADLLATSPFVNPGNGVQQRRITLAVIRNDDGSPREFVVQKQCIDETGKSTQQDGDWKPVFNRQAEEVQKEAWQRFRERSDEEVKHYPLADLKAERFVKHLKSLTIETGKG